VNEFELITQYFSRKVADRDVLLGIGDDGAIVQPATGRALVLVVDTMVEGVHFPRDMDAADIAFRAVAANLSDIAAMAALPRWMTLALTLATNDAGWLERFSTGLFGAANEYSVELIGGDTTSGTDTVVTVQIVGDIAAGAELRRSGARSGDEIFVTGTPGDAAAGLALWQSKSVHGDDARYLYRRFSRPSARVGFAAGLGKLASAAIDVSDGLYADIGKMLTASGAGGRIDIDRLPLSKSIVALHDSDTALEFALGGGDDYEIAFTAPADHATAIRRLAEQCELIVTRIGGVTATRGLQCFRDNRPLDYRHTGYRHFA
jgi:thiamine-monophosphate kinase